MLCHDEIAKFNEWLKSAGELPGVNLIELWDRYEREKNDPDVDSLPQYSHKPKFKERKEAP